MLKKLSILFLVPSLALIVASCGSSSTATQSTSPHASAHHGAIRIVEFPTSDLKNLGNSTASSAAQSATDQSFSSTHGSPLQALLTATNGTTYSSASLTGLELVVGGFASGIGDTAGEQFVQDPCNNNSSSLNPILLENDTSSVMNVSFGGVSDMQTPSLGGSVGAFAVLWSPIAAPQSGNANFCSDEPQSYQAIPYGSTLSVDPGYTGVVWAMLGGSIKNLTGGSWITFSNVNGGFYDFRLAEKANNSFSSLIWGEANKPDYGLQNGPVGFNIVSCAQNAAGGYYPNSNSVLVSGEGSGNIASSSLYSGELSYSWNQPVCFDAPAASGTQ